MINELVRACHPLPATGVTVLAGALALGLGQPATTAALAAATVGASQLSVGWANDVIDAARDRTVNRQDKPLVQKPHLMSTLKAAAWIATAVTFAAALAWGWPRGVWLAVALVSAQLYNWPLKATPLSIVPYLVSFAALPAFLTDRPPIWLIAAAALLGGAAHLANAIPDLADDRVTGVRGLPQRLGARPSLVLASILLLGATVTLVLGAHFPVWAAAAALLGAAALPVIGLLASPKTTFRAVIGLAGVDVVLLVVSGAL